jgi:hypothetical protein
MVELFNDGGQPRRSSIVDLHSREEEFNRGGVQCSVVEESNSGAAQWKSSMVEEFNG